MKLVTFPSWDHKYPAQLHREPWFQPWFQCVREGKVELKIQEHVGELLSIPVNQDAETLSRTQRWGGAEVRWGRCRGEVGKWGGGYNLPGPHLVVYKFQSPQLRIGHQYLSICLLTVCVCGEQKTAFISPYGSQRLSSGLWAWRHLPLFSEPSHWPELWVTFYIQARAELFKISNLHLKHSFKVYTWSCFISLGFLLWR